MQNRKFDFYKKKIMSFILNKKKNKYIRGTVHSNNKTANLTRNKFDNQQNIKSNINIHHFNDQYRGYSTNSELTPFSGGYSNDPFLASKRDEKRRMPLTTITPSQTNSRQTNKQQRPLQSYQLITPNSANGSSGLWSSKREEQGRMYQQMPSQTNNQTSYRETTSNSANGSRGLWASEREEQGRMYQQMPSQTKSPSVVSQRNTDEPLNNFHMQMLQVCDLNDFLFCYYFLFFAHYFFLFQEILKSIKNLDDKVQKLENLRMENYTSAITPQLIEEAEACNLDLKRIRPFDGVDLLSIKFNPTNANLYATKLLGILFKEHELERGRIDPHRGGKLNLDQNRVHLLKGKQILLFDLHII